MTRHPANIVSAILRAVIGFAGIAVAVGAIMAGGPVALLTFTVQSNLMIAASFLFTVWALLWDKRTPPEWLSGSAVFYIAITGLVFNFLINPLSFGTGVSVLWGLSGSDIAHTIMPIAAVLVWLVFAEHRRIPWRYVGIWLIYLVAYLGLIIGAIQVTRSVRAPYPFLDPTIGGWSSVARSVGELALAFAALAALMVGVDRLLPARTPISEHDRQDQWTARGAMARVIKGIGRASKT